MDKTKPKNEEDDNIKITVKQVETGNYGRRHFEVIKELKNKDENESSSNRVPTKFLTSRKDELNLESRIGKSMMVTKDIAKIDQPGFYCDVCDCLMKDSHSYYDHINGKKHNKMLGMNMKVERISADRVKSKLESLKRRSDQPIENYADFDKKFEEELKRKTLLKEQKKKHKTLKEENEDIEKALKEQENESGVDLSLFGLPTNFTSKKK